jgi:hypothetical protein
MCNYFVLRLLSFPYVNTWHHFVTCNCAQPSQALDMSGMMPSLNIGNGIVEIAALTAMIGSVTAASLILGNKGAAGLPWAAISLFGVISVIKNCIAGATPGWLRETLGVRTSHVDSAIGLSLNLESKYNDREDLARKDLGDAIAITCHQV